MQQREFIGVEASSAVSLINPIYAQPIGAVAHRTVLANGIHLHSPHGAMDRESASGWSASYATLRSALQHHQRSLFAARRWSRCPPLFDQRRH
jgi:hypothetical protein